jgi:hypothetical protein
MTLLHRLRCVALAVTMMAPAMALPMAPATATVIHGPSATRAGAVQPDPAWTSAALGAPSLPAGVAGLRVAGPQASECTDCGEITAPAVRSRGNPTLSVNVAILVLGTLWVGLMLRRIQLRSALPGLRGAGPRHAAGGH